jgi:chromosomal replication initiation ATPase DnaA
MQSAIHRAAETPLQIRMREELKLRRARMSGKPAVVKIVPVVPDENAAIRPSYDEKLLEEREHVRWAKLTSKSVPVRAILEVCARHYGTTVGEILSQRRNKEVVRARQVAMYLAKVLTTLSFPALGRRFGDRDHTTVLHGFRKVERDRQTNEQLEREINELHAVLR